MSDRTTRMLEAERALQSLEIQIEQYRLHLDELGQHPHEAASARAVLGNLIAERARQRKYCDLLAGTQPTATQSAKNGSRAA